MYLVQLSTMSSTNPDWTGKRNAMTMVHGRCEVAAGMLKLIAGLWYVFGGGMNP